MTKAIDMTFLFVLLSLALDVIVFSTKVAVVTLGVTAVVREWKKPIVWKSENR